MPVVKKVIVNDVGFRPVLVEFQNGKITAAENNLKSALYRREKETIVGVTSSNMLYTGTVDNDKNDLYNNFMLVHDRRSGKIRLIQVDSCTVSPVLEKKNSIVDTSMSASQNSASELKKQFGSKKTKKYTEQQERLKMNIDTVKVQLEKTISDVKLDETDMSLPLDENDNLYRPKINRNASVREQVYNLEDVVPKSILDTLSDEASELADTDDLKEFGLVPFAAANVSRILTSSSDENMIQKLTIFLYINYLMKFMALPVKNITRRFVICEKSTEVNKHIFENFTIFVTNRCLRPMYMKDKALCFIFVLAALASDYQVNVDLLAKDVKIGIKKCIEISRVLGFSSTKTKDVVSLKLPLPEPMSMSSKRKRK